jgi:hypothetical protein
MGTGFGATQGSGTLTLGSTYGVITNWSDTQILANVAPGAKSGSAQVSQGNTTSNAITFTVATPLVSSVNPNPATVGTAITITGTGFGAGQGSGNVWLGSTYGIITSWSDNQIVASVAASAKSGIVKVLQNGVWSDPLQFTVNSGSAPTITVSPSMMNMLVGETREIQALNTSGAPVTGLTWASSNTSVVTLSTDDPPLLTAVAPGHVTITAGDGVADVIVSLAPPVGQPAQLPLGTIKWSVPGDGSGVTQILPAVPAPNGEADVFAVQASGNIQAVTSDGRILWTTNVNPKNHIMADFQGGLLSEDLHSIRAIDALTGQPHPAYTFTHPCWSIDANQNVTQVDCSSLGDQALLDLYDYPAMAVHPDGTIFTIDGNQIVGIDPTTGSAKFSVPLQQNSFSHYNTCITCQGGSLQYDSLPFIWNFIVIGGDGYAYVAYSYYEDSSNGNNGFVQYHFGVVRVGPNGESSTIPVKDSYFSVNIAPEIVVTGSGGIGAVDFITDADQGILLSWTTQEPYNCNVDSDPQTCPVQVDFHTTAISQSGISSDSVVQTASVAQFGPTNTGYVGFATGSLNPVLQKEDGTYVGTLTSVDPQSGETTGKSLVSFNLAGELGVIANGNYEPVMATADGGVIATMPDGTAVTFDTNQAPTSATTNFPTQSWTENTYQIGSLDSVVSNAVGLAASFWAVSGGNASGSGTAIQQVLTNQAQGDEKQLPNLVGASCISPGNGLPTCGNINAIELLTDKSPDFIFQTYLQTFRPVTVGNTGTNNNSIMSFTDSSGSSNINVTAPGQKLTITLLPLLLKLGQGPFSILTERVDPTNHIISVVTLQGHPLAGWRYWRVYSIGTNDVVIETGAYDQPGPGQKFYAGYYIAQRLGTIAQGWREYMEYIRQQLQAPRGFNLHNTVGGIPLVFTPLNADPDILLDGYWDSSGDFTNYILNNVCQSTSCN